MGGSFALKGAIRYLREEYDGEELERISIICEDLVHDLSRKKGYLHPRALAAAASYIHKSKKGEVMTLEGMASRFRISAATLREYIKVFPIESSVLEASKNLAKEHVYGADLPGVLANCEFLHTEFSKKKSNINAIALAAAAVYTYYYKEGRDVSLADIADHFGISSSTLRDYVGLRKDGIDYVERAKTIAEKKLGDLEREELGSIYGRIDELSRTISNLSTAKILAALAYYLHKIKIKEYTTIEKVARRFNVSVPALRSYLEPYFGSIADTYLLFKKGRSYGIERELGELVDKEREMLQEIFNHFGTEIFELGMLFDIPKIPKGRWQLFIRKMSRIGLIDVYRKPLDPKQYCALVDGIRNSMSKAESLERWI